MSEFFNLFGGGKSSTNRTTATIPSNPFEFKLNNSPHLNAGSGGVNLNLPTSFTDRRADLTKGFQGLGANVANSNENLRAQLPYLTGALNKTRSSENPFMDLVIRPVKQQNAQSVAALRQGLGQRGVRGSIANNALSSLERSNAESLSDATARGALLNADFERAQLNDILSVEQALASNIAQQQSLLGEEGQLNQQELQQLMASLGVSLTAQQIVLSNATQSTTDTNDPATDISGGLTALGVLADNDLVKKGLSKLFGLSEADAAKAAASAAASGLDLSSLASMGLEVSNGVVDPALGFGVVGNANDGFNLSGGLDLFNLAGKGAGGVFDAANLAYNGADSVLPSIFGTSSGSNLAGATEIANFADSSLGLSSAFGGAPASTAPSSLSSLGSSISDGLGSLGSSISEGVGGAFNSLSTFAAPLAIGGLAYSAFSSKSKARDKYQSMWNAVGDAIRNSPLKDAQGNSLMEFGGERYLMKGDGEQPFGEGTFYMADGRILSIGQNPNDFEVFDNYEAAREKFQPNSEDKVVNNVKAKVGKNVSSAKIKKVLAKPVSAITSKEEKAIYFAAKDAGFGALGGDGGN